MARQGEAARASLYQYMKNAYNSCTGVGRAWYGNLGDSIKHSRLDGARDDLSAERVRHHWQKPREGPSDNKGHGHANGTPTYSETMLAGPAQT